MTREEVIQLLKELGVVRTDYNRITGQYATISNSKNINATTGSIAGKQDLSIYSSKKSSNQTITSNNTLFNDTDLIINDIPVGVYNLKFILYTNSNVAGGLKFAFTNTGTMVMQYTNSTLLTSLSALIDVTSIVGTSSNKSSIYEGTLEVTASGDLQLQWSQNTSSVTSTTLNKNSFIQLIKI